LEITLKNPPEKKVNFSLEKGQVAEAEELVKKVLTAKAK
jgi:hypothetical protein